MDRVDFQKYYYINYHLNSLCREWYKLKPSFEAKLTTTNLQVKDLLGLRLSRLFKRIHVATSELYLLLKHINALCTTYQLPLRNLFLAPNMGLILNSIANGIMDEITRLRDKFKDVKALPFKDLPYDFQSRLVALLPPQDCLSFKLAGKTAAKYVDNRGHFSDYLLVAGSSKKYRELKNQCSGDSNDDITSASFFVKSDNWYVKMVLYLNMNSTKQFDRAVKIVSGTYITFELLGPYTWKHAIHFMNVSNEITDVFLNDGMLLDAEDFDGFCEAVVQWLKQQKDDVIINIMCPDLPDAFYYQLKEYVETWTTFNVDFLYIGAIICPQRPKQY